MGALVAPTRASPAILDHLSQGTRYCAGWGINATCRLVCMAGTSSWLATYLDAEMFSRNGVLIHEPLDRSPRPPRRSGADVAGELGG